MYKLLLFVFAIIILTTGPGFAERIVSTQGLELWLVAAVPQTGDAVAKGHPTDWIKENIGITEEELSIPKNGPVAGDKIVADARFAWKEIKGPGGDNIIDFQRGDIFGALDNIAAYMYLYITSDKDREIDMSVGSDDTIKVWVNGKKIHDNPALRGVGVNQDQINNVKFKQGQNGLLIKVCEQGGGWAGWCGIGSVDGLRMSTDPKKAGDPIPQPKTVNYYITEFLNLIGPNPSADAAVAAHGADLIDKWTNGKYNEQSVANGMGLRDGGKDFPLVEKGARGWKLGEFTNFGGDNIQELVQRIFGIAGDQNNITWYGYTVIKSPDKRDVVLRAGSDDTIKIWLNGNVVHSNPVLRGASGFLDTVPITLNKGQNKLLVKVCEQGGGWSAFVGFDSSAAYAGLESDASKTAGGFAVDAQDKLSSTWGKVKSAK